LSDPSCVTDTQRPDREGWAAESHVLDLAKRVPLMPFVYGAIMIE
jgi:hypothetical protein